MHMYCTQRYLSSLMPSTVLWAGIPTVLFQQNTAVVGGINRGHLQLNSRVYRVSALLAYCDHADWNWRLARRMTHRVVFFLL